jgi:PAS domain S-box-containing protein
MRARRLSSRPVPLRRYLFVQFLALSLLPLIMVIAIAAAVTARDLVQSVEGHTATLSFAVRDQLETRLSVRQRTIELLSSLLQRQPGTTAQEEALMRDTMQHDPYLESLYVTTADGRIERVALTSDATLRDTALREAELRGVDLSGRVSYQASRQKLAPVWSDTFLSSLTGRVAAALSVPAGPRTVIAELSLQALSKAVQDLAEAQGNVIVVLDGHGRVIVHPDPARAPRQEDLSQLELVRKGMAGGHENGSFDWGGTRYLGSIAPIGPAGWSVLVGQPRDVVYRPLLRLGWALVGGLVLAVIGSSTAALLLARRDERRYRRLLRAAEGLARAEPQAEVWFDVEEFAQLWRSLRHLFEQVEQRDRETRAARVQLQAVLDAATEVSVIATDAQGLITIFNRGAEKILGYSAASVLGKSPVMFHDADEISVRAAELSLQLGRHIEGFETFVAVARRSGYEVRDWTYIRQDGSRLLVSMAATAVCDSEGTVTGFLGVAVDQTARQQAASLEVARQAAEAASQAKSEFLSRVSHELRTPLNAMLGFAQLLELDPQHPLDEHQRGRLASVQQAGWHLVQLIEDVLDLSRIEAGNLKVNVEPVDAKRVVDEALELVSQAMSTSRIRLQRTHVPDTGEAPVLVQADKTRLTQVMVNLLTNAIKYNVPQGLVRVHVDASAAGRTRIEVSDTGRGMSAVQLSRIFEPFNRLGQEQSGIQGTGIGLVITKRLIELMGGELGVQSEQGMGSRFTVTLATADVAHSVDTASAPSSDEIDPAAPRRNVDVLYIEDNPVNAMLMESIVAMKPFCRLHLAGTASEGASLAARVRPDLIMLDMHLPDGSGVALLHRLQAIRGLGHTKIVAVSADATQTQVDSVLAAGATAYLTKPVSVNEVLGLLDEAAVSAVVKDSSFSQLA